MVHGRYDHICAEFRWNVLEHFNFATDVVDRYAADCSRLALCWTDEADREMQKRHTATRQPDARS